MPFEKGGEFAVSEAGEGAVLFRPRVAGAWQAAAQAFQHICAGFGLGLAKTEDQIDPILVAKADLVGGDGDIAVVGALILRIEKAGRG